jgi:hypothetical protein
MTLQRSHLPAAQLCTLLTLAATSLPPPWSLRLRLRPLSPAPPPTPKPPQAKDNKVLQQSSVSVTPPHTTASYTAKGLSAGDTYKFAIQAK